MDLLQLAETIVAPALTALAGWYAGAKKRKNDFLHDMQATINMLADENRKLMEQVVELRRENAALRAEVGELGHKLENVETITRKA